MNKAEIAEKVRSKIQNRPDMRYVDSLFLDDTIEDAINDVFTYINANDENNLVESLVTPIKDLCVIRLNLVGSEGLISSSKAGTSESYLDNIPKAIRKKLQKYRSLP